MQNQFQYRYEERVIISIKDMIKSLQCSDFNSKKLLVLGFNWILSFIFLPLQLQYGAQITINLKISKWEKMQNTFLRFQLRWSFLCKNVILEIVNYVYRHLSQIFCIYILIELVKYRLINNNPVYQIYIMDELAVKINDLD